ncbi:chromate transporter [Actinomadura rudentiformis]|uniref:Chromate transporter n=2 Tax=Actinomadura rudentiformis TaxID=359158 RepID=A0A6H9YLC6_9ACTN|nr:chromate transporter [Actinomadura rudentiformis]
MPDVDAVGKATWVTFVPCFIFIFLGAPYVERLRGNASITAALTGITAAVVGVIANLAVHTLFRTTHTHDWGPIHLQLPEPATWRPTALIITLAALAMVFHLRWSVLRTLATCATLGLAATLIWRHARPRILDQQPRGPKRPPTSKGGDTGLCPARHPATAADDARRAASAGANACSNRPGS